MDNELREDPDGSPLRLTDYYVGNTRVAMRMDSSTLNYLLGDHSLVPRDRLGSQAITTNSSNNPLPPPPNPKNRDLGEEESRYYPWGTERYTYGTTPTSYHFTGQRLESSLGLYY